MAGGLHSSGAETNLGELEPQEAGVEALEILSGETSRMVEAPPPGLPLKGEE